MRRLAILLLLLCAGVGLRAQDSAAEITEPWRGMDRVWDLVLPPDAGQDAADRTLLLLVDPTKSLQKLDLPGTLAAAMTRHTEALAATKLAVARVGERELALAPTDDAEAVTAAIRKLVAAPQDAIQNVYAAVREQTQALRSRAGTKEILLITLDNGDAEEDVEQVAALLAATKIRVHVLTSEAYVADSYWAARPHERGPRGTKLIGGDAAFVDLPWGWLFQVAVANEVTPSGYAAYALNRLAAASRGRVLLCVPDQNTAHRCTILTTCLFCSGDHTPENESYWSSRLRPLAPSTRPRGAAAAELGADPCFRATSAAWRAAREAGLLRSQPPRLSSTSAGGSSPQVDRSGIQFTLNFERNAQRADEMAQDAERILADLTAQLARIDAAKSHPRQRAIAEWTRLMLQVTKVNLVTFAGWCRELAPQWLEENPPAPAPPEQDPIDRTRRPSGFGFTSLCLCHGVPPFFGVELPGGDTLRAELNTLAGMEAAFRQQHDQTPFVVAFHRQGIARFHLTYPGVVVSPPRERPNSKTPPPPETGGARPARGGSTGSGGGAGGPVTGGK